jgi:hypothetical protein
MRDFFVLSHVSLSLSTQAYNIAGFDRPAVKLL